MQRVLLKADDTLEYIHITFADDFLCGAFNSDYSSSIVSYKICFALSPTNGVRMMSVPMNG